ncbi:MAG: C26 family cysteine hydrolase domain-containing family [Candidatus Lokiarchaeota archaeon]|nr:C26 family cysteine hydrolase domain-containing family [Candidatus Lokiarchaeota archaeon]
MKTITIALVNCYPQNGNLYWLPRRKNLLDAIASYPALPMEKIGGIQHTGIHFGDLLSPGVMAELERADGAILSGSPLNVSVMDKEMDMAEKPFFEALEGYIRRASVPVLGICFGHQLAGHAFGCKVDKYAPLDPTPAEKDAVGMLRIGPGFDLLRRFPGYKNRPVDVSVEWKHQEEVRDGDAFAKHFINYASTTACKIQATRHRDKQIYGVQFHPESRKDDILANGRSPRQDGTTILHGFIDIVVEAAIKKNAA